MEEAAHRPPRPVSAKIYAREVSWENVSHVRPTSSPVYQESSASKSGIFVSQVPRPNSGQGFRVRLRKNPPGKPQKRAILWSDSVELDNYEPVQDFKAQVRGTYSTAMAKPRLDMEVPWQIEGKPALDKEKLAPETLHDTPLSRAMTVRSADDIRSGQWGAGIIAPNQQAKQPANNSAAPSPAILQQQEEEEEEEEEREEAVRDRGSVGDFMLLPNVAQSSNPVNEHQAPHARTTTGLKALPGVQPLYKKAQALAEDLSVRLAKVELATAEEVDHPEASKAAYEPSLPAPRSSQTLTETGVQTDQHGEEPWQMNEQMKHDKEDERKQGAHAAAAEAAPPLTAISACDAVTQSDAIPGLLSLRVLLSRGGPGSVDDADDIVSGEDEETASHTRGGTPQRAPSFHTRLPSIPRVFEPDAADSAAADKGGSRVGASWPRFDNQPVANTMVKLTLLLIEAKGLPNKRWFGNCDPFCIIEVEGRKFRSSVATGSSEPTWNEPFDLQSALSSVVMIRVLDKHASPDKATYGLVKFKPADILRRALAGQKDEEYKHVVDVWFVLQQKTGAGALGNLHINLTFEGLIDPTKLEVYTDKHVELASIANRLMTGNKLLGGDHTSEQAYVDIVSLLETNMSLASGCQQNYYSLESFRFFSSKSKVRQVLFTIVTSFYFKSLSWAMAFLAIICMGTTRHAPAFDLTQPLLLAEFATYIFLGFEILFKVIAFGWFSGARSFVKGSFFDVVDLFVFIGYWIEFVMPDRFDNFFTLRPVRGFCILLPLTKFQAFAGLTSIFMSIKHSFVGMSTVVLFLTLFSVGFGIFGVTFFQHSFKRRCTNASTGDMIIPPRWCKDTAPFESWSCAEGQRCIVMYNDGPSHFDNIGSALMAVFQALSLDEQYTPLSRALQGEPQVSGLVLVYFVMLTFFCRFLLFNLCVAVITATYQHVTKQVEAALEAFRSHHAGADDKPVAADMHTHDKAPSTCSSEGDEHSVHTARAGSEHSYDGAAASGEEGGGGGSVGAGKVKGSGGTKEVHMNKSLHEIFSSLSNHPLFEAATLIIVLLNTVMLAWNSVQASDAERRLINELRFVFQVLFCIELLLRMVGADSLSDFFSRGQDKFDFLVILASSCLYLIAHYVFSVPQDDLEIVSSLSALRFMRVVATLDTIQHLLAMTLASLSNIFNLLLFTCAALSFFAMCCVYIFCAVPWQQCQESGDFDGFWKALRSLYILFTSDNVNELIHRTMQPGRERQDDFWVGMPAVVLVWFWFVSQAILVNLYIAVIIENFSVMDTQRLDNGSRRNLHLVRDLRTFFGTYVPGKLRKAFLQLARVLRSGRHAAKHENENELEQQRQPSAKELLKMSQVQLARVASSNSVAPAAAPQTADLRADMRRQGSVLQMLGTDQARGGEVKDKELLDNSSFVQIEQEKEHVPERVLGCMSKNNWIRGKCQATAKSTWFTLLIFAAIFISCVALGVEPPTRDLGQPFISFRILDTINTATTVVFTFEFFILVFHKGLVFHQGAYLRNSWNFIDAVVLLLSWVDLSGLGQTRQARVLRLGRALRPLRLIKRNEGMRLIVDALLATWRPVSMIVLLTVCVTAVFSVIGMAMFRGAFWTCNNPDVQYPDGHTECAGNHLIMPDTPLVDAPIQVAGFLVPSSWDTPRQNFDTFWRSFITLLAVSTFNYAELFAQASAKTKLGQMPLEDNNALLGAVFFVVYTICASLFVMNLFVAFIIDGFNQLRSADAVERQKKVVYSAFMRTIAKYSPHRQASLPSARWRTWMREDVLPSRTYDNFFSMCVFFNITVLALFNDGMSPQFQDFYVIQNNIFFGLMVVETFCAVSGLGWVVYLQDPWVYIDLISILATIVAYTFPDSTFIRSFRLVRVLRVVNNVPALRRMLETLTVAVKQIGNVVLLMVVVFAMFAILCVNFLGNVREGIGRLGSPAAPWPANPPNFANFPVAMVVLFQLVQGDEWHLMMLDAMVQPPFCTDQFDGFDFGDCGVTFGASVAMFVGFKIVAEYVLLNLFIGMIIDAFMKAEESTIEFHINVAPFATVKTSIRSVPQNRKASVAEPGANARTLMSAIRFKKNAKNAVAGPPFAASVNASSFATSKQPSPTRKASIVTIERRLSMTEYLGDESTESMAGGAESAGSNKATPGKGAKTGKLVLQDQSCLECWRQFVGPGKADFIQIPDVHVLMRSLPLPLGFARNAFGEPIVTSEDRAVNKLIRAELNIIAVSRKHPKRGILRRLYDRASVALGFDLPQVRNTHMVTFDEVFTTLFHWRCPEYIPAEVKDQRIVNIARVVTTAHAVLMAKLIKRWIAISRLKKQGHYVPGARTLFTWMQDHAQLDTEANAVELAKADGKGLTRGEILEKAGISPIMKSRSTGHVDQPIDIFGRVIDRGQHSGTRPGKGHKADRMERRGSGEQAEHERGAESGIGSVGGTKASLGHTGNAEGVFQHGGRNADSGGSSAASSRINSRAVSPLAR